MHSDRYGSPRHYWCSDFDGWLGVHGIRAGDGLLCVVCSWILLVDRVWAGAMPLGVLEDISKNARIILRFLPALEADAVAIAELLKTLEERDITISRATVDRALKELKNESLAESKGGGTSKDPQRFWRSEPVLKDK